MQSFVAKEVDFEPEIVVQDLDDKPIMLIDVRASRVFRLEDLTLLGLENYYQQAPFLMFVHREYLRIYQSGNSEPVKKINALEIFKFYDPGFNETKMYQFYLKTLIKAWLRDLDINWNSPNPPAMKEMEEVGILEKFNRIIIEELDWE